MSIRIVIGSKKDKKQIKLDKIQNEILERSVALLATLNPRLSSVQVSQVLKLHNDIVDLVVRRQFLIAAASPRN